MLVTANPNPLKSPQASYVDDLHPVQARWFAIRVGHRKEKAVVKQLAREGVEYFLPLRDRPYKYKSKTGVRQIPLLGGYLFVRIVSAEVSLVLRPSYVFGFVKLGRNRKQVTQQEIDLLRRISSDDTLEWAVEAAPAYAAGCLVEIARGPLAGVRGHYVAAKNKKTFIISFGGLDARLTTCEVSPGDIIPLRGLAE